MDISVFKQFLNKRVSINLDAKRVSNEERVSLFYNGVLLSIDNGSITLRDKFNKIVVIDADTVIKIEEMHDAGNSHA